MMQERQNARKEYTGGASCLKLAMKSGVLHIIFISNVVLADTFVFEAYAILLFYFYFLKNGLYEITVKRSE